MKQYVKDNASRLVAVALLAAFVGLGTAFGIMPDLGWMGVAAVPMLIGDTQPSMKDVMAALEEQGKAWEAFRKANDERLKAIKDDSVDKPLLEATTRTINERLNELGTLVTNFQAAQQRLILASTGLTSGQRVKSEPEQKHEQAMMAYLRKGDKKGLESLDNEYPIAGKTAYVGSDADGGYFVTPDLSGRMVQKIFETSNIRGDAAVVTISTDALEGVLDNDDSVTCGWVGEQQARPATGTPKTAKWRIPVFEMYAMPEATQQLLDDAAVDIEGWLSGKVVDKMVRTENTAFFTGDGITKPRGLLTYPTAATADSSRAWGTLEYVGTGGATYGAAPNGSDKLIDLVHRMKAAYRAGAKFYMSRTTLGETRKLKTSDGTYIWLPSMTAGQPSQLLGYPVQEAEDMPAIGANALAVMFANLGLGYQIVDRQGIRVLRDPFTNKPYVRFYTTRRVGGDVLHFEAIKFLKFA